MAPRKKSTPAARQSRAPPASTITTRRAAKRATTDTDIDIAAEGLFNIASGTTSNRRTGQGSRRVRFEASPKQQSRKRAASASNASKAKAKTPRTTARGDSPDTSSLDFVGSTGLTLEDIHALVLDRLEQKEDADELPDTSVLPVTNDFQRDNTEMPQSEDIFGVANYTLAVNLKLFINGKGEYAGSLTDTSHRFDFNLDAVEAWFDEKIQRHMRGFKDYTYDGRAFKASLFNQRENGARREFTMFDDSTLQMLFQDCDDMHHRHPRSGLNFKVYFEVKMSYSKPEFTKHVKALDIVDIPSSPPTSGRRSRTINLLEQGEARRQGLQQGQAEQEGFKLRGSAESALMSRWQCHDQKCSNTPNYCFIGDKSVHYAISPADMIVWSGQIASGQAGIDNPPIRMYKAWESENGGVSRGALKLIKKEKLSATERLAQIQDRLIDMQARQVENEMTMMMMMMMESMEQTMEQTMEHLPFLQAQQSVVATPPVIAPRAPAPYSRPPATSNQSLRYSLPLYRSSSPLLPDIPDDNVVITQFFAWLINSEANEHRCERLANAREIIFENGWTSGDMKKMADRNSQLYKLATNKGIPDGIAARFAKQLDQFKIGMKAEDIARRSRYELDDIRGRSGQYDE